MSQILINDGTPIEKVREEYIRFLANKPNSIDKQCISESLFNLGLTMYVKDDSKNFESIIYNVLSKSEIDPEISLYPEQLRLLNQIDNNDALIVSAPTSFGKTFCVFEYIIRKKPKNIVMIVPTLALVDEYLKKIIKKYENKFKIYKKYININEETKFNKEDYNIFILTHDKALENNAYKIIKDIDLLVIDEVYKLQRDINNDRVLILNLAYYYLSQTAKKYILLAPFIKDVENKEKLHKKPKLFCTNFSPVVNDVIVKEVLDKNHINNEVKELLDELKNEKTLVYFPQVSNIPKFVNDVIVPNYKPQNIQSVYVKDFIKWAKQEIHEEWYLIKAMERGFLIHNGQLPSNGFRLYQLDLYDNSAEFNRLLCTSTILEGVNMSAKNIIITSPARNERKFDSFDFYNLVGRTGRLYQHYLGMAYYIKIPEDPNYIKEEAIKNIEFELSENDDDFNFHVSDNNNSEEYNNFLSTLGISALEYKEYIGNRYKLKTVKRIYNNYINMKNELVEELEKLEKNPELGRGKLIKLIYKIIKNDEEHITNEYNTILESIIINFVINKNRYRIKTIINKVIEGYKKSNYNVPDINYIISKTMKLKSSYIENDFYYGCKIICYFLKCNNTPENIISVINSKILSSIEYLYFSDSKCKKVLKDLGIYEYDVEKIINVIGDDKEDIQEIISLIKMNKFENLSYISNYIISRL